MLSKTIQNNFINDYKKNYLIEYLKQNHIDFKILNRSKKQYCYPKIILSKSFIKINYHNFTKKSYENKKNNFKICQTKLKNLYDFLKQNNINFDYTQGEHNQNLSANISNLSVFCNIVIPLNKSIKIYETELILKKNDFYDNHFLKEVEKF